MITAHTMPSLERTLVTSQKAVDEYTERLHQMDPSMWAFIDEIALLVDTQTHADELLRCLPELGWERFNDAVDRVRTSPIPSVYRVKYVFFQHPEKSWRLEVMQMLEGYSPLHGAIVQPVGGALCVPVHASFKTADEEQYAYAVSTLAESGGYLMAQRCDSTYGRFSYWTALDRADRVPYLKPRVNLRDAQESGR